MKKLFDYRILLLAAFLYNGSFNLQGATIRWKAGVSRANITPDEFLWMRGYSSRTHPADGKITDLWAKCLALEDSAGRKAVLVTMDVCGMPKPMADSIKNRIRRRNNLSKAQVIISFSHTHTGPFLRDRTGYISYNLSPEEKVKIDRYSDKLEKQVFDIVQAALGSMEPVKLFSGRGVARFAVNRRNNVESALDPLILPAGPSDHSVPVIKVERSSGDLMAVVFGYACHATTLSLYQWSGDYPGFAQLALEDKYPGAMAMFFQGTGADQNPLPRRTISLARQYGSTLAAAVEAVLTEPMRELRSGLVTGYTEINLPYSTTPSKEELQKLYDQSKGTQKAWYAYLLQKMTKENSLPQSYPYYPLQIWRLGQQNLAVMGGEVVVDYSIRLKQIMGPDLFVMGYANDYDPGYIPSARVLGEGGYEGATSIIGSDQSAPWRADIESLITGGMLQLAKKTGIPLLESKMSTR